jgi:hypothetical protein
MDLTNSMEQDPSSEATSLSAGQNNLLLLMMISGATAQTGPWPPFTGSIIVL